MWTVGASILRYSLYKPTYIIQLEDKIAVENFQYTGITNSSFGEGLGPILLDNVNCLGMESTILECQYDTRTYDCSHYQDAGIECLPCKLGIIYLKLNHGSSCVMLLCMLLEIV